MRDLFRMIRIWIARNPFQFGLGFIGFIAAILIATLGLYKFIFVLIVTVVFFLIGRYKDKGLNIREFLRRITLNKYK